MLRPFPARRVLFQRVTCDARTVHPHRSIVSSSQSPSSNPSRTIYDVAIVGGGIVGLATGRELLKRHPHLSVVVLEKENQLAIHQSARNSGVIHAGIYYAPGSARARLCVKGAKMMYDFCEKFNVPHKRVGKLIVAVKPAEIPGLNKIYENGLENNVQDISMIGTLLNVSLCTYCYVLMILFEFI